MKQACRLFRSILLFTYVSLSFTFSPETLIECSGCLPPNQVVTTWTDNSTVWRCETLRLQVSGCSKSVETVCSRSEDLGGDLYLMLFRASPDEIGLNPFHFKKTRKDQLSAELTCKDSKWYFEDIKTPVTHILCDQFIISKPIAQTNEPTTTTAMSSIEAPLESFTSVCAAPETRTQTSPSPSSPKHLQIQQGIPQHLKSSSNTTAATPLVHKVKKISTFSNKTEASDVLVTSKPNIHSNYGYEDVILRSNKGIQSSKPQQSGNQKANSKKKLSLAKDSLFKRQDTQKYQRFAKKSKKIKNQRSSRIRNKTSKRQTSTKEVRRPMAKNNLKTRS